VTVRVLRRAERAERPALDPNARSSRDVRRRTAWIAPAILLALAVAWLADPRRREATLDFVLAPFGWRAHATWRATRNGGVILGWKRLPGAESYSVLFLAPDGKTIDWIDGIETREVVLTRDALPRHLVAGSTVRWTVVALRSGKPVGHSPVAPLRLP